MGYLEKKILQPHKVVCPDLLPSLNKTNFYLPGYKLGNKVIVKFIRFARGTRCAHSPRKEKITRQDIWVLS